MRFFVVDLRSLALFRIVLGLIVVADTLVRFSTVGGVYSEHPSLTAALLAIVLVAGTGLTLGYRSPLCAFSAWLPLALVHWENRIALYGGDCLILALLFWSIFSPVGARASIDAARIKVPPRTNSYLGWGTSALFLQMLVMYLYAGLTKTDPVWWGEGTALYYVFNLDIVTTSFGQQLLNFPEMLRYLTWATMFLEIVLPFVVLLATGTSRLILVLIFICFHLGHLLTMQIGAFPIISICGWLAILPKEIYREESTGFYRPVNRGIWTAIERGIVISALAIMIVMNATRPFKSLRPPDSLRRVTRFLGLNQNWLLFGPSPWSEEGWFVFDGTLKNGSSIDPFLNAPVSFERPPDLYAHFQNYVWLTYLNRLQGPEEEARRRDFARYLCGRNPDLVTVDIHRLREITPAPGQPAPPLARFLLLQYRCP